MIPNRFFGVELEVGNEVSQDFIEMIIRIAASHKVVNSGGEWADSINNDYWHVKYDSSCGSRDNYDWVGKGNHGWEIASFKAKGNKDLNEICKVVEALNTTGDFSEELKVCVNDYCGFHIHIDVEDFSEDDMGRLLAQWYKIEEIIIHAVPYRRVDNDYCKLLTSARKIARNKTHSAAEIYDKLRATDFRIHGNHQKRYSLNLVNYSRFLTIRSMELDTDKMRKTIELRLPEGTINHYDVRGWVSFFLNFVEKSKNQSVPENLKTADDWETFFEHAQLTDLRDQLVVEIRVWLLKRFLKYSQNTELIQSINAGSFIA